MVKCDICLKTISLHFPLHSCQPTLDRLIKLVPNYQNLPTNQQAEWIDSVLYCLGESTWQPEWYTDHKAEVEKLVDKYGQHLIIQNSAAKP